LNLFQSIVHGVHSSVSATRDWALGTQSLQYNAHPISILGVK